MACCLLATGCANAADQPGAPSAGSTPSDSNPGVDTPVTESTTPDDAQPVAETDTPPLYLLPDPTKWVVVEDWGRVDGAGPAVADGLAGLQLDVAPLDAAGVPELGRLIQLGYDVGPLDEFDRLIGDARSAGELTAIEFVDGIAEIVNGEAGSTAHGLVWRSGVFVRLQTMDPETDLVEVATSLTVVDEPTWRASRGAAEARVLQAVEAAVQGSPPGKDPTDPLPHFVLPEPWQLKWVTDMTIWTDEQRQQSSALGAARRPSHLPDGPLETGSWYFSFAENSSDAPARFRPDVWVGVSILAEEPDDLQFAVNRESIEALGLTGVWEQQLGRTAWVTLLDGTILVNVRSTTLGGRGVQDFLDAAEWASGNPIDGVVTDDARFALVDVEDLAERPPSWHASWQRQDHPDAQVSVWRLTVPELRSWLTWRGENLEVPDDAWEIIAADGVIELGAGSFYDVTAGLLFQLGGVEFDQLAPIALEDWIELVEPFNVDPLRPR